MTFLSAAPALPTHRGHARISSWMRAFLLALCFLPALLGSAFATPPTGTVGWGYPNGTYLLSYASDPVSACQGAIAFNKSAWGNDQGPLLYVKRSSQADPQSSPMFECWSTFTTSSPYVMAATYLTCGSGYYSVGGSCVTKPELAKPVDQCPDTGSGNTPSSATGSVGNPAQTSTGSKYEEVTDYATEGPDVLQVKRTFRSMLAWSSDAFGRGWNTNLEKTLLLPNGPGSAAGATSLSITPGDGSNYYFTLTGYTWVFSGGVWSLVGGVWGPSPADSDVSLTKTVSGSDVTFDFRDEDDRVDHFALVAGAYRATTSTWRSGYQWTYAYNTDGTLATVTDTFGRTLTLTWTNGAVSRIAAPGSVYIDYTYSFQNNDVGNPIQGSAILNSATVKKSDGTQAQTTTYHHEDTNYSFLLTGITDARGVRTATWEYNYLGRVTSSSHAGGADLTTISYDDTNDQRTVTNALGRATIYDFAPHQSRLKLDRMDGQVTTHCPATAVLQSYDGNGFISSQTDAEGRVANFVRDARGLPTSVTEAYGTAQARTKTITWDSTSHVPTQVVTPGLTTDYTYTSGRLTQMTETDTTSQSVPYSTNGQTRTWTYTYTTNGELDTVNGPLSGSADTVDYDYDSSGYLTQVTDELGHVTDIASVNGRGLPLTIEDENGIETDFTYDIHGRVLSITRNPGGSQSVTSFAYDAIGEITQVTLPTGGTISYTYNDARRLTAIQTSSGERIEYTYDAAGNVTQRLVKNSGGTTIASETKDYDELGRLLHSIGAASQSTAYAYDKVGNTTSVTDSRSNVYGNTFDALNRLKKATEPTTGHTDMIYDAHDKLATHADQRALSTSYVRNGWGDVIREVSPDRGTTDSTVNALGLVTSRTDARGVVTNYTYDAAGRLLTKEFPAHTGENVTYTYDSTTGGNKGVGRLTGISDATGTTAFTYDARGNVTLEHRVVGGVTYDTAYAYDLGDNVAQITYPSGRIVTYARDSLGRVTGVTTKLNSGASAVTVVSSVAWRPFGPLASLSFGNGLGLTLAYDNDSQLTDIDTAGGGTTVQDLHLTYDAAGNITAIADNSASGRSQSFTYDSVNRLTNGTGAYGNVDYAYDLVGNRTSRVVHGTPNITYASTISSTANKLTSVSDGTTARSFGYSSSGNVTSDDQGSSPDYALTYNDNDRLASVTAGGSALATYTYDAQEHRVIKTVAGGGSYTHHFMYDRSGQLIAESDATGTVIREYLWLGGLPVGVVDASGTPTLYFIHADQLGAPQKATDASKTLVWDAQIQPFGEIHAVSGALTQLLMFPGQYRDAETGFNDNWHRTYDPSTGRYLQADPLGIGAGPNVYAYAGGNPITFFDLSGLDILYLNASEGAFGQGHAAFLVGKNAGGWTYFSKDGIGKNVRIPFENLEEFKKSNTGKRYDRALYRATTEAQDAVVKAYADTHYQEPYDLTSNNCGDLVNRALRTIGVPGGGSVLGVTRPNSQYDEFSGQNGWTGFTLK